VATHRPEELAAASSPHTKLKEGGVRAVDSWTPEEVSALLALARKREAARFIRFCSAPSPPACGRAS